MEEAFVLRRREHPYPLKGSINLRALPSFLLWASGRTQWACQENLQKDLLASCLPLPLLSCQCGVSRSGESDLWSNSLAVTSSQSESLCPLALFALGIDCLISSVTFKAAELWGQEMEGSHTVLPLRPAVPRIRSLEGKRLRSKPGCSGSSSPLPEHYL